MSQFVLDEIDRVILQSLQEDARHNTNAAISDRVSVSPSTVRKRIERLEENGVIQGYLPQVDYENAGYQLQVLFVCSASIAERERLVTDTLDVSGVVNVRELMTGQQNVHIRAIGSSNDDITRIARSLDELGYSVADEIMIRSDRNRPLGARPDGTEE